MDKIRERIFSSLEYGDPHRFLIELRKIEATLSDVSMPENVRRLRTNGLKQQREMRDAALLCVGISKRFGYQIRFAPTEDEDFDFVATWSTSDTRHICRVQLKEVAPEDLNPKSSIDDVLDSLAKYADPRDLTVAIRLNRTARFEPTSFAVPTNLAPGGLWVYGCVSKDHSKWAVWGDFVPANGGAFETVFEYPTE